MKQLKHLPLLLACIMVASCSIHEDMETIGHLSFAATLETSAMPRSIEPVIHAVSSSSGMVGDSLVMAWTSCPASGETKSALNTDMYDTFGLFGYVFNGSWDSTVCPLYVYDERCSRQGASYVSDNAYHLIASSEGRVRFMAYAPYGCSGLTLSPQTETGAFRMEYTIPSSVADQVDLMAGMSGDCSSTSDVPSISFNHVLTAVRFVTGSVTPAVGEVTSVAIRGAYGSGSYRIGEGWSSLSGLADYSQSVSYAPSGTEDEDITADEQTFFLIPQTLPAGAVLEIVYDDGRGPATLSCSIAGDSLEEGKVNTYRLCFSRAAVIGVALDGGDWSFSYPEDISAGGDTVLASIPELTANVTWSNGKTEDVGLDDGRFSMIYAVEGSVIHSAQVVDATTGAVSAACLYCSYISRAKVATVSGILLFRDGDYEQSFHATADVYQARNYLISSELVRSWYSDPIVLEKKYGTPYQEDDGWTVALSSDRYTSLSDKCPSSGGSATLTWSASHQERTVTPWSQYTYWDYYMLYHDYWSSGIVGNRTEYETYYSTTEYGDDYGIWYTIEDEPELECTQEGIFLTGNTVIFSENTSFSWRIATFYARNGTAEARVDLYQAGK